MHSKPLCCPRERVLTFLSAAPLSTKAGVTLLHPVSTSYGTTARELDTFYCFISLLTDISSSYPGERNDESSQLSVTSSTVRLLAGSWDQHQQN
jgi:hypothetical protein